ncbi:MAG: nitroreductase [Burkholderiales bacterium]|jgi:nitroreductase|nr:nitroreductase [Burkholderiales bacterium]MBP7521483.1 nitroreductase [Leptothrix sp. (in: b-proteobacteria)]HQY10377.1 nitroreductase [Burkholderiaceae bacterium]
MNSDDDLRIAELADALIQSRRHIGPRHLVEPAPDEGQLRELFTAAAAAPDHERLRPWRFLVLGPSARERLAECFAHALRERDADAALDQVAQAREKAFRAPVLILAIADLRAEQPDVPPFERLVSLGCAIQNLLLAAQARGFASGLSSGRALQSAVLRQTFGVHEGEQALCFISLGTATRVKQARGRPAVDEFVAWI